MNYHAQAWSNKHLHPEMHATTKMANPEMYAMTKMANLTKFRHQFDDR